MNPPPDPGVATVLTTVRGRIARVRGQGIGEQDTKAALIVPVLRALGWDTEDLEDVKLEYRRRGSDNPVDFALFLHREACLFIEAKALGTQLDDPKWAAQMLGYAMAAGVEWVALTDGDGWRIYNSHAKVPFERKLFRSVRVSDQASAPEATLSLLAKERLAGRAIDRIWKAEFIDRQVSDALRRLFGSEPDAGLVRRIKAVAPGLTTGEVRASLGRLRVSIEAPNVSAESIEPGVEPMRVPERSTAVDVAPTSDRTPWRHVTLAQLVEAGLIRLPIELEHRFRGGPRLTARLEAIDRIVFDGQPYDSLSTAGGMARRSIRSAPLGRAYPQTNGWDFWNVRRADGSLVSLDALRRELHEGKVVSIDEVRRAGA